MNQKESAHPLGPKMQKIADLLEHLIAVEMYRGGATQPEISKSLDIAVGKVNRLVKGVIAPKDYHGTDH